MGELWPGRTIKDHGLTAGSLEKKFLLWQMGGWEVNWDPAEKSLSMS